MYECEYCMIDIVKLALSEQKSNITNLTLRQLPEWFGIEKAIVEYASGAGNTNFYAAYSLDKPVGFISIRTINIYTSEIYVTAVLKEYQHRGIGKKLLETAQEELINSNVRFLMVKTLGDSHPDEYYMKTREFYYRMGFYPLEELKEIWGEECPCLIMVKSL